jgi:imidazoleglycerol-phosphate dehydratase
MTRVGTVERTTGETSVRVRVDLDGSGAGSIATGIGFFDHLLDQLARHGRLDLEIEANGDLIVDEHHTVEDTGIAIGRALDEALGDRAGIGRFGDARVPLDEALAECVVDLGGRAFSRIQPRPDPLAGANAWLELVPHFLESLAREARMTLHLDVRGALSAHHHAEASMKAFARALRQAVEPDPRAVAGSVPSTKGTLR